MEADIGLIGLAVMGENLALNMANNGYAVAVYNRNAEVVTEFVSGRGAGKSFVGCQTLEELCKSLKRPRKVMMMIRAGRPVDDVIEQIIPFLEPGDIVIDGGNSHYPDSNRRVATLKEKGIHFVGAGISGGEEGALKGPSIMPGGSQEAWPIVKEIFQKISAKVEDGAPCCDWVGPEGSGHFVKMVHNGIEYGDMQLICEAYHLLKDIGGLTNQDLHEVFSDWNDGDLNSFLIEISSEIFAKKDEETGTHVVDLILDAAGQKGTGKWTAMVALDLGMPLTLIGESVFSRCLSSQKEERMQASKILVGPKSKIESDKGAFIRDVRDALYCSKVVSYAQGFTLMSNAAREFGWKLNLGGIALMWRGGCIIRSKFLANIKEAFDKNTELPNLLLDPFFQTTVSNAQAGWRRVIAKAAENGVPVPAFSSALAYFDGYRSAKLPANLLQAQRDYFGAHTYERIDRKRGEFHHTNWTGRGGNTSSTTYNA
jgi:6-phosphogluconate dehydrogenase